MYDLTIDPMYALTIRPGGGWKYQYRARLSEYRVWTCRDGRKVWKYYRTIDDNIAAGNIRDGKSRCVPSPHNQPYRSE